MSNPSLRTRLCDLLGIEHPIIQTGMGWVAGSHLTAATTIAGGFGIIASATMDLVELERAIVRTRERTDKPFGVNMRGDSPDGRERVALLVREKIRVASFAAAPNESLIKACKDAGLLCIQSIGARRHAEKVAEWGVDVVIAQGAEAGGHVGTIPTSILIPQVADAVDIPIVAAGGFCDGRGLVAALAYGASGIAMGTRFLLTSDSQVPITVKQQYLDRGVGDTIVTSRIDGHPTRALRTALVAQLERTPKPLLLVRALANAFRFQRMSGISWSDLLKQARAIRRDEGLAWSQVLQSANTPMLLRRSMVQGNPDSGVMPSGMVVGRIEDLPSCRELIDRIVAEAEATLQRLEASGKKGRVAAEQVGGVA